MDRKLISLANNTKGFMPEEEGLALYFNACRILKESKNPMLEIGSYCGKSAIYLGAATKENGSILFSVDHHRGSEENQIGWEHHDTELFDPHTNKLETLFQFRKTLTVAGLDDYVIPIVGNSKIVGRYWNIGLSLLFIDGGHSYEEAMGDYIVWSKFIQLNGLLLIHDVFENESDGGRPPFEIYQKAMESSYFTEIESVGSLKVLKKI
jgi:hypothetical protein